MMTRFDRMTVVSGLAAAMCAASAAHADFVGAHVEDLGDLGAGVSTWRVYVDFDSPADQLLAISANENEQPMVFQSIHGDALRNTDGPFAGMGEEDFPQVGVEAWDSWVTIGSDAPGESDTAFSPGFLGVAPFGSAIQGSSFEWHEVGGWFDLNPGGSPVTGEAILIAQFTVEDFMFSATADWQGLAPGASSSGFVVSTVPAPGTLALLALGALGRRRRR